MRRPRPTPPLLIRGLLAGWLVMLPWFTVMASPASMADNDRPDVAEMPCHAHAPDPVAEAPALDCPHCAGDSLAPCKCCSFATGVAIPTLDVSTYSQQAGRERHAALARDNPLSDRHERLYRPPIHRFV